MEKVQIYSNKKIFSWLSKNIALPASVQLSKISYEDYGFIYASDSIMFRFNQFPCVLRFKESTRELYMFNTWLPGRQGQIIHLMNDSFMGSPEIIDFRKPIRVEDFQEVYFPEMQKENTFVISISVVLVCDDKIINEQGTEIYFHNTDRAFDNYLPIAGDLVPTLDELKQYIPQLQKAYDLNFNLLKQGQGLHLLHQLLENGCFTKYEHNGKSYHLEFWTNKIDRLFLKAYFKAIDFEDYFNFILEELDFEATEIEYDLEFLQGIPQEDLPSTWHGRIDKRISWIKSNGERKQKLQKIRAYLHDQYYANDKHVTYTTNSYVGVYEYRGILETIESRLKRISNHIADTYPIGNGETREGDLIAQRRWSLEWIAEAKTALEKDDIEKQYQLLVKEIHWQDKNFKGYLLERRNYFQTKLDKQWQR